MKAKNRSLIISSGDYKGIGPEIVVRSIEEYSTVSPVIVVGDFEAFCKASVFPVPDFDIITEEENIGRKRLQFFDISKYKSEFHRSFEFVRKSVDLIQRGHSKALVTAPISKENWQKTGVTFSGHTTYLAYRGETDKYAMFFWSEKLRVVLYTIHLPLSDIFSKIKEEDVKNFIRFVADSLRQNFGTDYHFILAGLNPHAGENGILGSEEREILLPVVRKLAEEMSIEGPEPPDTIFLKALERDDAVVVSLYHDQGLIPFKLLNMHKGVNMTLGLPFIRTSPDHGTAFEIAGKGCANAGSMIEALKLADQLNQKR